MPTNEKLMPFISKSKVGGGCAAAHFWFIDKCPCAFHLLAYLGPIFGTIFGIIFGTIFAIIFGSIFGLILSIILGIIFGIIFGTLLGGAYLCDVNVNHFTTIL